MALAAETILAALMSWPLRLTHRAMPAAAIAVAVRLPVTGLPHRELRFFPFRSLALGAWQRRPDQPAMNRTVVLDHPFILDVRFPHVGVCRGLNASEFGVGLKGDLGSGINFVGGVIGPRFFLSG